MTLKQLSEFSNVGEQFLPFHDDTCDAVSCDFDRFNRSLADTCPCGLRSCQQLACGCRGFQFKVAGRPNGERRRPCKRRLYFGGLGARQSLHSRAGARCSAIIAAVSSSADRQRSALHIAIATGRARARSILRLSTMGMCLAERFVNGRGGVAFPLPSNSNGSAGAESVR